MTEPLVTLRDVSIAFHGPPVVDHVSLRIDPGEIITLIGPNGAGKTTLIKAILGVYKPTTGEISRRSRLRVGYMPQRLALPETLPLSVAGFLGLTGAGSEACRRALERVGVRHIYGYSVHHLSGGEIQRMLLARALLREPELLVLDEPAQGVDITGQAALYELIRELRDATGCAVLMISHDLHLVMSATDQVLCLNRHMCCSGPPEHISSDPAFVELFGRRVAGTLAVYHHHHDHSHDPAPNARHAPSEQSSHD